MKKKVAIQGIAGSYHDIAARNYFEGEEIEIIGCNTFRDVVSAEIIISGPILNTIMTANTAPRIFDPRYSGVVENALDR